MAFMSVLVITAQNPITSIIYLIGVFVMAACYLSCMGLSYIGLTYLVVYVGAVAVLFLFVVMMFNIQNMGVYGIELMQAMPLGAIIGVCFLMEVMSVMPSLKTFLFVKLQSLVYTVQGLLFGVPTPTGALSNEAVNMVYTLPSPDSAFTYLSQLQSLGLTLYTYNALWLIIIGLVLLLSMMGPISLCLRINKSLN
jgi:NADH-ubiquinone oxidoreductase chain 6